MKLTVLPFWPEHLALMDIQPAQRAEYESQPGGDRGGQAWTAFAGEAVICSAGLVELWSGRAYAWALVSAQAGPHMLQLVRVTRTMLDAAPFRRIEMYVDAEFEAGHRFARSLGFVCETPNGMCGYLPDGRAAHQYARIRT